jgi:uncharacterized metal-binding protein
MGNILRALPVLYPCPGCPLWGETARDAARVLDGRRIAEMSRLDEVGLVKAKSRFPVFAIDGCPTACARGWLERHGVKPHRGYILDGREAADAVLAADRITADLR